MLLSFEKALATVREKLSAVKPCPAAEILPLEAVRGRVLAEDVGADRDYPPFHRSTRDGYAVRSADTRAAPLTLECRGEVRAGEHFAQTVGAGECVQIMTGAPLPQGADAVVMLEDAHADGTQVRVERRVAPHENVVRQGSEAAAGALVLRRGRRLGAGEIGLLAAVGKARVEVFRAPEVSILPTGDEVVSVEQRPQWFQIRNSNALALAAQVEMAGGAPRLAGIAPDRKEPLRAMILEALKADMLLVSGGVSAGKYDFVAPVLSELGAEFFFQGVAIRPGKPLAFGRVSGKFFFGLPGNPVSTYVTFELFVRPALALLGGAEYEPPLFLRARLGMPFRQTHGLTAFLPARVEMRDGDPVVELVGWQGSGDLVGVAAANCFLVVHPEQTELAAGDWVDVLPKSQ
jgi:molybdopterin molybdotransferase